MNRKTVIYETLTDPTVIRIGAEKGKNKLFAKYLLQLNNPAEIEFVSIEKYYEPFVAVSGKYSIDYYRKCTYTIKVDRDVKEVILLNQTFTPKSTPDPRTNEQSFKMEGEEQLVKENRIFLLLDKLGQQSRSDELPSGPSEKNPEKLVKLLQLQEIPANVEVDAVRNRIMQRPADVNRIVSELFEINERALIYTPRFRVKYKSQKIGKKAYMEFDGVTARLITNNQNILSIMASAIAFNTKRLYEYAKNHAKTLVIRTRQARKRISHKRIESFNLPFSSIQRRAKLHPSRRQKSIINGYFKSQSNTTRIANKTEIPNDA